MLCVEWSGQVLHENDGACRPLLRPAVFVAHENGGKSAEQRSESGDQRPSSLYISLPTLTLYAVSYSLSAILYCLL